MYLEHSQKEIRDIFNMNEDVTDPPRLKPIYFVNREYQRNNDAWSVAAKRDLIASILRGWLVVPIQFLVLSTKQGLVEMEIIDGQQRIGVIERFFNNEIYLPEEVSVNGLVFPEKSRWRDWSPEQKHLFQTKTLAIVRVFNTTQDERDKYFLAQNAGRQLTASDKRHAMGTIVNRVVKDLATRPAFGLISSNILKRENVAGPLLYLIYQRVVGSPLKSIKGVPLNTFFQYDFTREQLKPSIDKIEIGLRDFYAVLGGLPPDTKPPIFIFWALVDLFSDGIADKIDHALILERVIALTQIKSVKERTRNPEAGSIEYIYLYGGGGTLDGAVKVNLCKELVKAFLFGEVPVLV